MVFQIQKFKIADLIFICTDKTNLKKEEIQEIKNRFENIVNFIKQKQDKDYNASFIKGSQSSLPYNASTYISSKDNQLVLHFTNSYDKPLMMIFDLKNEKVCNYVDIEQTKSILNNFIYEDIIEQLSTPVTNMNNRYKNISNFNNFIEQYEKSLFKNVNKNTITNFNCFEYEFEQKGE